MSGRGESPSTDDCTTESSSEVQLTAGSSLVDLHRSHPTRAHPAQGPEGAGYRSTKPPQRWEWPARPYCTRCNFTTRRNVINREGLPNHDHGYWSTPAGSTKVLDTPTGRAVHRTRPARPHTLVLAHRRPAGHFELELVPCYPADPINQCGSGHAEVGPTPGYLRKSRPASGGTRCSSRA
jgi:hypothetical protein